MRDMTIFNTRRSDTKSVALVCGHLVFVFLPVFLSAYFSGGIMLLCCYLWFGLSQNSVANLMHEAAHRLLFRKGKSSDFLGQHILAPFFLTGFELYRRRHWVHHNHTGDEHDTKTTYLFCFDGTSGLLMFVLRCMVGIEAVKRFMNTQRDNQFVKPLTNQQKWEAIRSLVVFHGLFGLSVLATAYLGRADGLLEAILHAALAYGFVYVYAMVSLTILLSTLRAIAEHQIIDASESRRGNASIRNMRPTLLSRLLFGSYGFCEHGTHHAYPSVPHYNLPEITKELSKADSGFAYGPSYWKVLVRAIVGKEFVQQTIRRQRDAA